MTPIEPIHFSALKHIARSPAHYRYELTAPPKKTRPFAIGSVVHDKCLLDPDRRTPVAVFEGAVRRGKVWEAFQTENPGAIILSPSEAERVQGMQESILQSRAAMDLLEAVTGTEVNLEWTRRGLRCEGRIDAYGSGDGVLDKGFVVELKTGREEAPHRFLRTGRNYGYHAQLAWYRFGLSKEEMVTADCPAYIIHVESTAPFVTTVYELTQTALSVGDRVCSAWMETLAGCMSADRWPGYSDAMVPFEVEEQSEIVFDADETETEGGDSNG